MPSSFFRAHLPDRNRCIVELPVLLAGVPVESFFGRYLSRGANQSKIQLQLVGGETTLHLAGHSLHATQRVEESFPSGQ
jgi:hypothetical protein